MVETQITSHDEFIREECDIAAVEFPQDDPSTVMYDIALKRLKEFSFYLIEAVEIDLNQCLDLLEEKGLPKKSNTLPTTIAGALTAAIPTVGKGVSSGIKKGELFILNRIDKRHSRLISNLVYYFSDNKESIRQILIQASIDLFYCFEHQFVKLTCAGGNKRAMQKLAEDATNRIFSYFLDDPPKGSEVTKDHFTRGVILGGSSKNAIGMQKGRTLITDDENRYKWTTLEIFTKTGLHNEMNNEFYTNKKTQTDRFGYRRIFDWEDFEEISRDWITVELDNYTINYQIRIENFGKLRETIKVFVSSKNINEEADLDRMFKHDESMDDRAIKHHDILESIKQPLGRQEENRKIIETSNESNQRRLEVILQNVIETKERQIRIEQSAEEIKQKVSVIEKTLEEYLNGTALVKREHIEDIAKKLSDFKHVIKAVENCRNAIEKTDREVNRIVKQTKTLFDNMKEAKLDLKVKKSMDDFGKKLKTIF